MTFSIRSIGAIFVAALLAATLAAVPGAGAQALPICDGLEATIVGTAGPDTLVGTEGQDVIVGLQGDDTIRGLGGDDVVCAGQGNDTIFGGGGFDIIFAAQGNDTIFSANGASTALRADTRGARMFGGAGNDTIHGSNRWDRMQGGVGNDTLFGYEGRDWMRAGADTDSVDGGPGIDDLHGGNGRDTIQLTPGDIVKGGAGLDLCNLATGQPGDLRSCGINEREEPPPPPPPVHSRIISLSPSATEMLFAIGAGDLVLAVDSFSNFPPEAPLTPLASFGPDLEAIAEFGPTLVISAARIDEHVTREEQAEFEATGIENLVLPRAETLDDVYDQIEQVGAYTGHNAEASELVAEMKADIQAVVDSLPQRQQPLSYYHEIDPALFTVTSDTFIGEIYKVLGLENAIDDSDEARGSFGFPMITEETLFEADPDIIFLADTLFSEQTVESVSARPGWNQLSAVRAGNIVELNDDVASRWGPRVVEFIQVAGAAVAAFPAN